MRKLNFLWFLLVSCSKLTWKEILKFSFIRTSEVLILAVILWSLMYIICQTLIERWVFRSFWKASQFNMMYSSYDVENFEIWFYKVQKNKKAFLGHLRLQEEYTYLRAPIINVRASYKIHSKSITESTNFIRLAVHKIGKIMQLRHYKVTEKLYF